MSGVSPLGGRVLSTTDHTMVVNNGGRHGEHTTVYLFGPERANGHHVWADCDCGEQWRLKGDSVQAAIFLKALHEDDPFGARFIQVLYDSDIDCAAPGRETTAFTAYLAGGVMVGLIDPEQQARNSSVHRTWQYGVQVCDEEGDVLRTYGMYLDGQTALFLALAEVARLTENVTLLDHPLVVA